jgi:putative membrane protein
VHASVSDTVDVTAIERPSSRLLAYYLVASIVAGPLYPFFMAYRFARFRTLRYRFDEEGISMSWGVLLHRETHLTYSRIQDIHLASGLLERYLGLARIQIQTASGRAGAEMTLEGLLEYEQVRDFVYRRMRGSRHRTGAADAPNAGQRAVPFDEELIAGLEETAAALRDVRTLLERQSGEAEPADG